MTHVADLWLPTDSNFRPGIGEETCTIKSYDGKFESSKLLILLNNVVIDL